MSDSHVYVRCNNHHWVPARVVETKGDKAVVSVPQYSDEQSILSDGGRGAIKFNRAEINLSDYPNGVLPLQNVDEMGWLNDQQDMVDLPFLHEAGILYNLKSRHVRGKPYTRTGDILIAVNPYEWFHDLYTTEKRQEYAQKLLWNAEPGSDPRKFIEPHVYETSTLSYKGLAEGRDQSILVSGESGAGKTETVKICMNHIAMIQNGENTDEIVEVSKVVERVVQSNPLLEAFGNAKTSRNDNSSRFGKYLQLQFSTSRSATTTSFDGEFARRDCKLVGSQSEVYLLEKSRVIQHDDSERNFHIFYQLLSSSDDIKGEFWPLLKGKTCESFRYVGYSSTKYIEGKSDQEHFQDTLSALALVGIRDAKLRALIQAIAAVLQLGNISFTGCEDKSSVSNRKDLDHLAELIGLPLAKLEESLTTRTMKTKGESVKVTLSVGEAQEARDSFAKSIYNGAFTWLVNEINQANKAENTDGSKDIGIIGLLDIFGFECFGRNGFEQLCINYANERLQHKFTEDIFRQVQEEYKFEGLALNDIRYDDNHQVLDLIESRMGLLAMLNEECVRPGGCDKEFVYKAIQQNKSSPALVVEKRFNPFEFGIRHYAGQVKYTAGNFVKKNNDTLPDDMRKCAGQSSNEIIAEVLNVAEKQSEVKSMSRQGRRNTSTIAAATVWTKYKGGLQSLMSELRKTQSRYIRCIKPNEMKKPTVMQHGPTLDQLRSAGVIAAVTITRSAFPNRLSHSSVLDRFRHLSNEKMNLDSDSDLASAVEKLLGPLFSEFDSNTSDKSYAVGLTRTYFRAGALEFLEAERIKGFDPAAETIQKVARGFLVRKRQHNKYISNRNAATLIQKLVRMVLARRLVRLERESKKNREVLDKAATTINAIARGVVRRIRFKQELKRYREVTAMKVELKRLQELVEQSDAEKEEAVKNAELRVREAMQMIQDERSDSSSSAEAQESTKKLEAKTKEIEKMRADNKRVRANIKLLEGKFKRLSEELRKKQDFNEKETEKFMILNNEAKAISDQNAKESENQEIWKKQAFALVAELKRMNKTFGETRKIREQYQQAMTDILKKLRNCKQEQLVEDSIFLALEADAEVKAIQASFEAIQAHLKEKENGGKKIPESIQSQDADETGSTELDSTSDHSTISDCDNLSLTDSSVDFDELDLEADEAVMAAELEELSKEVNNHALE